jgi:uncharacterized C2H2 Zn-finger protein
MVVHLQIVHSNSCVLPCPACEEVFTNADDLESHKADVHAGEPEYACHHCGNGFWSKRGILEHVSALAESHSSQVCDGCGEILASGCYRQHVLNITRVSIYNQTRKFWPLFF